MKILNEDLLTIFEKIWKFLRQILEKILVENLPNIAKIFYKETFMKINVDFLQDFMKKRF